MVLTALDPALEETPEPPGLRQLPGTIFSTDAAGEQSASAHFAQNLSLV